MSCLCDSHQRVINYLRVSVTDRCNLRCVYCMPEEGVTACSHADILRYEEIARVVRVAAELGISRVRLTGGEPLVRRGFVELVRMIAAIPGIEDLSMTTNGTLLAQHAQQLAESGLRRVNVSLDTLSSQRFAQITRLGSLEAVLAGIDAARRAGLQPLKINMVVLRGINDDEVVEFARRSLTEGWHVRFIEMMPVGEGSHWSEDAYVPSHEIRERIEGALGPLEPATLGGNGPARYWRLAGASGTIGLISPLSEHFCQQCNRLRLTADGRLMPCLLSDLQVDVRAALRSGADDAQLRDLFRQTLEIKPTSHHLDQHLIPKCQQMSKVGG